MKLSFGKSWKFTLECLNHPSHRFVLVFTNQMVYDKATPEGRAMVPHKVCQGCKKSYPVLAFIKHGTRRADGYLYLTDTAYCHLCERPDPVTIWSDPRGRCRMRLELRGENGRPVNFYDEKKHRWVALKHVGVRRMKRSGRHSNEFRLQPYHDRSTSKTGVKYGRARTTAQEALQF